IGTATAIDPIEFTDRIKGECCKQNNVTWQGTLIPDEIARQSFIDHLLNHLKTINAPGSGNATHSFEIALLAEGTTAYGQKQRTLAPTVASQTSSPDNDKPKVLNLTFPLHISRLRSIAWKNQANRNQSFRDPFNFQSAMTPLPFEEDQGTIVPIYSDVSANYAEVVLATILEEIERQHIRYLGIVASDVRDRIFLAREVHHHSPNLVLFFLNSELLFLHPEINHDFQGSLLISTYPLSPQSKLWSNSFYHQNSWLQFPSQSAQGIYNATLALLDKPGYMQEYEPPSFDQAVDSPGPRPLLWLSVVGRDNIWPLTTLKTSEGQTKLFEAYLYPKPTPTPPIPKQPRSQERLHSESAYITFHLFILMVCLLPTYGVLSATWSLLKRLFSKSRKLPNKDVDAVQTTPAATESGAAAALDPGET